MLVKSLKAAVLYGLIVWAVPFVIAFLIFPLRSTERPLFESIMPVVLALATVGCALRYAARHRVESAQEGLRLGVLWLVISVLIDAVMFGQGPMKMTITDYVKDIGVTYLMIPVITLGLAAASARKGA